MDYSETSDVAIFSDAPTRVFRNGNRAAATPRPKTRASNLEKFSWIVAISQHPLACVFHTLAPLAERHCPAPPLPVFIRLYPIHLKGSRLSFAGSHSLSVFFQL
jgi:hypothetical protein